MQDTYLLVFLTVCALLVIAALLRAVLGPRFTDRMVAVNCITTLITCIIVVLALYLQADYLLDVALIYALLGFLANVILTRLMLQRHRTREKIERGLQRKTGQEGNAQ